MSKTLQDLLENKVFNEKLVAAQTEGEVRELFSGEGVEISDEQLENLRKLFSGLFQSLKTMDRDELENVVGGGALDMLKDASDATFDNMPVVGAAFGALAGLVTGSGIKNRILNATIGALAGYTVGLGAGNVSESYSLKNKIGGFLTRESSFTTQI
jgi:hypothetical protein